MTATYTHLMKAQTASLAPAIRDHKSYLSGAHMRMTAAEIRKRLFAGNAVQRKSPEPVLAILMPPLPEEAEVIEAAEQEDVAVAVEPSPRERDILDLTADNLPAWKRIVRDTWMAHQVTRKEMMSPSRRVDLVIARNEAMWRLREELGWSLPRIGRLFGRDHTTVLHALRRHEARLRGETYTMPRYGKAANA